MSVIYANKSMSLVEQKKLQWAKEREELASLGVSWGTQSRGLDRTCIRTQYLSAYDINQSNNNNLRTSNNYNELITTNLQMLQENNRQRSPSLPPLPRNNYEHGRTRPIQTFPVEDETSGYASDSNTQSSPEFKSKVKQKHVDRQAPMYKSTRSINGTPESTDSAGSAHRPSVSTEERARWGDRGVAVGPMWEALAHYPRARFPNVPTGQVNNGAVRASPNWLERELARMQQTEPLHQGERPQSQAMVVGHVTPEYGTMGFLENHDNQFIDENKTHLRGQNIHVDDEILAEREVKRLKALEVQEVIKKQLLERENRRKEEKENRIREEQEEEERIRCYREKERERVEQEQRLLREREEKEKRKRDIMQRAIEDAERSAKENKKRHGSENVVTNKEEEACQKEAVLIGTPIKLVKHIENKQQPQEEYIETTTIIEDRAEENQPQSQAEGLALVLQTVTPFQEMADLLAPISLQGLQLAVLLPPSSAGLHNIACGTTTPSPHDCGNRVLTPTKYRQCCEVSTQTDSLTLLSTIDGTGSGSTVAVKSPEKSKFKNEKNTTWLESKCNKSDNRKQSFSDNRFTNIEDRPKWGVNKPLAQYVKQSEKDPFYTQKRKQRLKIRQRIYEKHYDTPSSDESRSSSPDMYFEDRTQYYRTKNSRNDRNITSKSYSVQHTEIVPLESDNNGGVYIHRNVTDGKTNKRKSFSEKFVTAKYEKLKLNSAKKENNENWEISSTSERRKKLLDDANELIALETNGNQDDSWPGEEVLEQLTTLRDGLIQRKKTYKQSSQPKNPSVGPNLVDIEYS